MVIRAAELYGRKVRGQDGKVLGKVHEIHADGGQVRYLTVGAGGLLQRLTASHRGRRIDWEAIVAIDRQGLLVGDRPTRQRRRRRA